MRKIYGLMLAAFFVFLIALPAYSHEDNTGRAYYDFGVFAYEEGDYKTAENYFTLAIGFEPNNPYYNHYLGKTYLKTGQYEKAQRYLTGAWNIDANISGLTYDMAMLAYKTEKYSQAAQLFMQTAKEDKTDVLANYYAGLCLMKSEQYGEASGYFVNAAAKSPTIGGNGYYYAALCYEKTGDFDKAIEMFEKVRQDPNAEKLKENAEKWIEAIRKKQKAMTPYSLYLKLGRRYDTNPRLEPLDIDLYSEKKDWATVLFFSGRYDLIKGDTYTLGAGYSHYQSWYDSLREYDLTGAMPNVYLKWHISPVTLGFTYQPSYYWLDMDGYLMQHRLMPEITWNVGEQFTARFSYSYDDNRYLGDETRTGHAHDRSIDVYYKISERLGYLFAGISYENDTAASPDQSYDEIKTRLGLSFNLPYELNMVISGKYNARHYDNSDSFYNVKREDEKYMTSVSLYRKLYEEWLGIMAEASYTKNRSNINAYEYERIMTTLSLTASY